MLVEKNAPGGLAAKKKKSYQLFVDGNPSNITSVPPGLGSAIRNRSRRCWLLDPGCTSGLYSRTCRSGNELSSSSLF
jgi:hypothetical protein